MPSPIPLEVRKKIIELRQSDVPYSQIALRLSVSESVAKKLWVRFKLEGESGLLTRYENCGRKSPYGEKIRSVVLAETENERGGPYLRSVLSMKYPKEEIPHERTIQRWWKSARGADASHGSTPRPRPAPWSKEAHQVWQIDGKEQIELANGQLVSWLNIVDEASRSPLRTEVFPLCDDEQLPP